MIRAKFRCVKVEKKIQGQGDKQHVRHEVLFRPVTPRSYCGADEVLCAENTQFWDATPSGTAELTYGADTPPFEVGDFYYIDMRRRDGGHWKLWRVELQCHGTDIEEDGSGHVEFSRLRDPGEEEGLRYGKIEMGIEYWSTVQLFGLPGQRWRIDLTFAEKSDGTPVY